MTPRILLNFVLFVIRKSASSSIPTDLHSDPTALAESKFIYFIIIILLFFFNYIIYLFIYFSFMDLSFGPSGRRSITISFSNGFTLTCLVIRQQCTAASQTTGGPNAKLPASASSEPLPRDLTGPSGHSLCGRTGVLTLLVTFVPIHLVPHVMDHQSGTR